MDFFFSRELFKTLWYRLLKLSYYSAVFPIDIYLKGEALKTGLHGIRRYIKTCSHLTFTSRPRKLGKSYWLSLMTSDFRLLDIISRIRLKNDLHFGMYFFGNPPLLANLNVKEQQIKSKEFFPQKRSSNVLDIFIISFCHAVKWSNMCSTSLACKVLLHLVCGVVGI